MTYRGKFFVAILSAGIAFYAFFGVVIGWWIDASAQQPINDPGAQIRIFESVLQHIQNDYVDEPDLEKVRNGALRGLADGLDPYTSYLTAEQVTDYQANKNIGNAGIGAEFSQVSGYLYIISVVKGSPADKSGLMAGDVIEYIETKATRDISLYDAKHLIIGDEGTKVRLRVLRSGSKPQTLDVVRSRFNTPEAVSEIKDGNVGVIRVYSLAKGESAVIEDLVRGLKKKNIQKIVLDLRNVANGELDEAVNVANLFIREGDLAKVIGRENKVLKSYAAVPEKHLFEGQATVLIDLGTAGAAEVVASAFLERKRGDVVGERSFGAGTEQQLFKLKGGDGFLLTTAKWASAGGTPFLNPQRANAGIKPSVEVKRPETPEAIEVEELLDRQDDEEELPELPAEPDVQKPKQSQQDIQLQKAIELLKGKAKVASM